MSSLSDLIEDSDQPQARNSLVGRILSNGQFSSRSAGVHRCRLPEDNFDYELWLFHNKEGRVDEFQLKTDPTRPGPIPTYRRLIDDKQKSRGWQDVTNPSETLSPGLFRKMLSTFLFGREEEEQARIPERPTRRLPEATARTATPQTQAAEKNELSELTTPETPKETPAQTAISGATIVPPPFPTRTQNLAKIEKLDPSETSENPVADSGSVAQRLKDMVEKGQLLGVGFAEEAKTVQLQGMEMEIIMAIQRIVIRRNIDAKDPSMKKEQQRQEYIAQPDGSYKNPANGESLQKEIVEGLRRMIAYREHVQHITKELGKLGRGPDSHQMGMDKDKSKDQNEPGKKPDKDEPNQENKPKPTSLFRLKRN